MVFVDAETFKFMLKHLLELYCYHEFEEGILWAFNALLEFHGRKGCGIALN